MSLRFSRLIFDVLELEGRPVNRNDLLLAADAFLCVAQDGNPDGLALARTMAYRAMDWAVFDSPQTYAALCRAADMFGKAVTMA